MRDHEDSAGGHKEEKKKRPSYEKDRTPTEKDGRSTVRAASRGQKRSSALERSK